MQLGKLWIAINGKKSWVLTDEMEWGSKFYVPDARESWHEGEAKSLTMEE